MVTGDLRPGPLPTYDWASASSDLVPVAAIPAGLPAWTDPAPGEQPDAPRPEPGALVQVAHPRIRLISAYWHEGGRSPGRRRGCGLRRTIG